MVAVERDKKGRMILGNVIPIDSSVKIPLGLVTSFPRRLEEKKAINQNERKKEPQGILILSGSTFIETLDTVQHYQEDKTAEGIQTISSSLAVPYLTEREDHFVLCSQKSGEEDMLSEEAMKIQERVRRLALSKNPGPIPPNGAA